MKIALISTLFTALLGTNLAYAQVQETSPESGRAQSGIGRMKDIIDGVSKNGTLSLPTSTQQAISSGAQSAAASADLERLDSRTVDFAVEQSSKVLQQAREAYVAALPPRDRALGASVLLGDGAGGPGQMFIFVSRSMPESLLRAYAVDAFYMGATLVVKGVRKGDTLKEYISEAMEHFNSIDGMTMAGLDINPNLFDMFDVKVVPAVVWTNRAGLNDIGSGCQNVAENVQLEKVNLTGPDGQAVSADKPTCAKVAPSTYYKLSGALSLPYVLDRFQEAGLAKTVVDGYRTQLAERTGNVHEGSVTQAPGNAMAPIGFEAKLDRYPKAVLQSLQQKLASGNVQRGPFGPTFSPDTEDDAVYRQELNEKVRHGLGL